MVPGNRREAVMDTRASIEALLDRAYEARRAEDVEAVIASFHEDGRFLSNGAPERRARAPSNGS